MKRAGTTHELSRRAAINILMLLLFAVLLIPLNEVTLGHKLKLIAIHAGLNQTALFVLGLNSLLVLISWIFPREMYARLIKFGMAYAVFLWILNYSVMLLVTRLTWGGFDWNEPRMAASTELLFILLPYIGLNLIIGYDWLIRFTTLMMGIFSQFLIRFAPVVTHPADPVGAAADPRLRFHFIALSFLILVFFLYNGWILFRSYYSLNQHKEAKHE